MRLILVHPPSPADAGMFDAPADDPGDAPWISLRNALRAAGVAIATTYRQPDAIEGADWVCFMNVPDVLKPARVRLTNLVTAALRRRASNIDPWTRLRNAGRTDRAVLFLWEPEVVLPENYMRTLHQRFARIFTWKRDLIEEGDPYHLIVWPQPSGWPPPSDKPFTQRKLLVNFSGNKKSSHQYELYSARVDVIRHMETNFPEDFDHYGPGWSNDFSSWRGTVPDKREVYPNYRFGLCYENMQLVRGYITEKIFDCLRTGVIPIYWGAPDIAEAVDPAAFVDRRQFPSTEELVAYIRAMDETTWLHMRRAGERYLTGPGFARFLPESFAQYVIDGLAR